MRSDLSAPVEPIRWDENFHLHFVDGFEEASLVLRGAGWSSNPARSAGASAEMFQKLPGSMFMMDPPDHTRLRSLISPAFSPRVIERLRPRVVAIVDAVLDELADEDEADIVSDVGFLVPLAVIAELLDVGVEGAELFREQTPKLVRTLEFGASHVEFAESAEASAAVMEFLTPLLMERRREPGNDFISSLLAVDGLSVEEILATCVLVLTAGHETTGNLIPNATLALLNDPAQLPHLMADPGRAVEELLRMEATSKRFARIATTGHDIGGHRIEEGQLALIDVQKANCDPRRAPDAHLMDLSREPLGHLAFGFGPHFCLGASLARLETIETLTRLFTRFPDLALTGEEPVWRTSSTFHGLEELPVLLRG